LIKTQGGDKFPNNYGEFKTCPESFHQGRFPANIVLSHNEDCEETCTEGCPVAELDRQSLAGGMHSAGKARNGGAEQTNDGALFGIGNHKGNGTRIGDTGGASRFFFQAKHDKKSECIHIFVSHVRESFKTILPTIENIALTNAEDKDVEQLAPIVSNAASQCDSCATHIARDIAAIKTLVSRKQESQACQDFIGSCRNSILARNLVFIVEEWASTGIIPTIQNLSILFGCVRYATEESIKQANQENAENIKSVPTRFLYQAKASKRERNEGCESNGHPTVKSKRLMSYLITLVTPPQGICLDPFMGSGSTGVAAIESGFRFIGIEKDPEYFEIARKRIYYKLPEFKKAHHDI
jgi:hypothetical protein